MARAQATDFLHNMRFHVEIVSVGGNAAANYPFLTGGDRSISATPAGFMSVTAPDMQVTAVPYKEGTWVYERKYPGEVSMGGDIQMQRGVARGDSSFWKWIRCVAEGSGEYRVDLEIRQYHRGQALTRPITDGGDKPNSTTLNLDLPARVYHVYEAFPTSHNPSTSGFGSTDGEISIMELSVGYEHFEVEDKTEPPVTA